MIIYIDEENKPTKEITNTPIELQTDIKILKSFTTDEKEIKLIDGKLSYIDKNFNVMREQYTFIKKDKIDENTLNKFENKSLDEYIYESKEIKNNYNTDYYDLYKTVQVTEDNLDLFDIDEILYQEHLNLLNESTYTSIITNIIKNVDLKLSSFKLINEYKVVLSKNNKLIINIKDIQSSSVFCLENIDKNLLVYLNNKKVDIINNKFLLYSDLLLQDIKLEIINKTEYNISIIDPYIFIK